MPSRIFNTEPIQSGLDAFLTGAGEAYTGIKDERRKRQVEQQQDELLRQQMENASYDQQRRNIEAGVSIQQGVRPDPVSQATSQASGVRAKIGAILSRVTGGGAPAVRPTGTLVKTGPSAAESLARIGEEGANSRNAASIEGNRLSSAMREAGDDRRTAANIDLQKYEANLNHEDRLAAIAAQKSRDSRTDSREDARDLRDYGRQLNEEIASLQRMAADKNGIMQQVGGQNDPVAAYQARQREIRARIGELHQQLGDVNATMSRRAIGSKLAQPAPKAKPGIPAAPPPRVPTLEEDIQAASRPGR